MNTTVQKWGNSLAVRLPSSLAKDVHMQQGSVVEIAIVEGKMVLKSKGQRKYSLPQLLKGVTPSNRHPEQNWGKVIGQETW
jgi:antitoxin MazE